MKCTRHEIDEDDDQITLCLGHRFQANDIEMFNCQAEYPMDADGAEALGMRLINAAARLRQSQVSASEGMRNEAAIRHCGRGNY